jgi:hypothetical protein
VFSLPLQQSVFVVALGVGPRKKKWFADRGHHWQLGSVAVGIGGNVGSRDLVGVERIGYGKGGEEWSGIRNVLFLQGWFLGVSFIFIF